MGERHLISKPPFNLQRIWRRVCVSVSRSSLLTPRLRRVLLSWAGVRFGGRAYIGSDVMFDGIYPNLIEIGQGSVITSGTRILSHFFDTEIKLFYSGEVVIGERVFIGMNTLIVNSVKIGDDSVVGAGSVVTKDIPPGEMWGGNPARFIKKVKRQS